MFEVCNQCGKINGVGSSNKDLGVAYWQGGGPVTALFLTNTARIDLFVTCGVSTFHSRGWEVIYTVHNWTVGATFSI